MIRLHLYQGQLTPAGDLHPHQFHDTMGWERNSVLLFGYYPQSVGITDKISQGGINLGLQIWNLICTQGS